MVTSAARAGPAAAMAAASPAPRTRASVMAISSPWSCLCAPLWRGAAGRSTPICGPGAGPRPVTSCTAVGASSRVGVAAVRGRLSRLAPDGTDERERSYGRRRNPDPRARSGDAADHRRGCDADGVRSLGPRCAGGGRSGGDRPDHREPGLCDHPHRPFRCLGLLRSDGDGDDGGRRAAAGRAGQHRGEQDRGDELGGVHGAARSLPGPRGDLRGDDGGARVRFRTRASLRPAARLRSASRSPRR